MTYAFALRINAYDYKEALLLNPEEPSDNFFISWNSKFLTPKYLTNHFMITGISKFLTPKDL